MAAPRVDWDLIYQQQALPPWSIGAPQPELAALIDQGKVHGEVLDSGCGHAALSLELAQRGYPVVGLDISATAIARAAATAAERGLANASFARVDITDFGGYDGRFDTVMDCGLLHALPIDRRQSYINSIHRAAAPGASLYILAFASRTFGPDVPGPNGFTADELRDTAASRWSVDEVRPAMLYGNDTHAADGPSPRGDVQRTPDGHLMMPAFLLSAHKE